METLRLIVAGGRDFNDTWRLTTVLDFITSSSSKPVTIICGKAKGADTLGEEYAKAHDIPVVYYPAQWDIYGKSAGFVRNKQMAANADALLAFWNGKSKGTRHMIAVAERMGLNVHVEMY